jgi:hypothetical protein
LESKIEKLSSTKKQPISEIEAPSLFEKMRNRGSILEAKPVTQQSLLSRSPSTRSVPIVKKNIDTHGDIKPFQ